MNVIEVQNAVKSYGSLAVLRDFQMNVKRGVIYALMGSSGCGKTTLLECIVGTRKLTSGSIKIFNESVGMNKSNIGYMPQSIALIEEFSFKELIYFFGTIYGMSKKSIEERLNFLVNLLELPDRNSFVKNYSGGEKRRISLAVCLIHQPDILLLDEPSVGLDPLLRHKIWDFLKMITITDKTTVIITTHYIEEATQATTVGLLRNGILVAEDSPANILNQFETDNLETAFLKLCERQGELHSNVFNRNEVFEPRKEEELQQNFPPKHETSLGKKLLRKVYVLKALTSKNFIQAFRRPAALGFMLIIPIITLVCFYNTIGGDPIGLKIGIVDNEISHFSECSDPLLKMTTIVDFTCRVSKISCRFINSIKESTATKVFYKNFDDAYADALEGNLVGVINFSSNFTSSMKPLNELQDFVENYTTNGEIQVFLDQSDQQINLFMKNRLYETFQEFIENLMQDCGKSKKVGNSPIHITKMFAGSKDETRRTMIPGIMITLFFFMSVMLTTTAFVSDRLDGVWNRILLADVEPLEVLLSHIVSNLFNVVLQCAEVYFVSSYVYDLENLGSFWAVAAILLLTGIVAILYGLAVSIVSKDYVTATFGSTVMFFPLLIMCGIFWLLEAIPWYFRYIGYCLPFTLPTVALRNILYKGFTINSPSVQLGFSALFSWIFISLLICFFGLRMKKFCSS